jgi:hypothetical protein
MFYLFSFHKINLIIVAAAAIIITHIQDLIMDKRRERKKRYRTNYITNFM